ncbi:MAG: preprotein translocase subunit YajC [Actinomycetales bacterium]|nr:MAG: preprotein translocase subunit YajC [Actinomycetales bacterium]
MFGDDFGSLLFLAMPLLLLGYLFYSQRRRMKQIQAIQASVEVGDDVRTTSGLFGHVVEVSDAEVHLEVTDGVVLRFDRRAIDIKLPSAGSPSSVPEDE